MEDLHFDGKPTRIRRAGGLTGMRGNRLDPRIQTTVSIAEFVAASQV